MNYFQRLIPFVLLLLSSCSDATNACFTISDSTIDAGEDVFFDASCSEMTSLYEWGFGDGHDTVTSEQVIHHTYSSSGTYVVELHAIRKDKYGFVKSGNPEQFKLVVVE